MSIRNKVIKLAYERPELREKLLPLLKKAAPDYEWWAKNGRSFKSKITRAEKLLRKDPAKALKAADELFAIMDKRGYPDNSSRVQRLKDDAEHELRMQSDKWASKTASRYRDLKLKLPGGVIVEADFIDDDGGYYDFYLDGEQLNEGEPWWVEDQGVPKANQIKRIFRLASTKTAGFSRKDFEKALQKERKLKHYTKDTIEGIAYAMDQWAAHADLEDKDDLEGRETDLLNEIDENTGGDQEIDLYKDEKSLLNVFSKVLKLSSKKGALNPLTKPELSRKASLANQKGQTKRTHLIKMAFENPELRSEILKKLAGSVNTQSFLQELLDSGDVTAPDEDYYGDASDFEGEDDPEQAAKDEYDRNMQDYLNTSSSTSGWGYTTINASDFPDGFDLQQGGSYGGDIVVWDSHSDAEEAAVKELVDMFEGDPGTVNVEKMIDNGFLKNDDDAKETYIDEDASNTAGDEHLLEQIFEEELDEIRETKDEAEETLDQVRATIAFYGDALKELKRAEGTVKKDLRARKIKGKPSRETKKWLDSWKKVFTAEADAEEYISDEWDKQIASLVPLSFSKNFVSKSTPDQYFLDAEEYIKQLIKLMGGHMKPLTNIKQTAEKAIAESDEKESNILGGEDSDKIEEWVRGNVEDNVKYYGSFFQYLLQEFGQSADSIISTTEIDLDYEGWAEFVVEHDGAGPTLNSWDGELYETRSFVWAVR